MIARQIAAPNNIQYINWATWEFDLDVDFDYAATGAKTTKKINGSTKVTGSGAGKGATSPVLSGATANNSAVVTWS